MQGMTEPTKPAQVIEEPPAQKPENWDGFLEALKDAAAPEDFFSPELPKQGMHRPDPFADWEE